MLHHFVSALNVIMFVFSLTYTFCNCLSFKRNFIFIDFNDVLLIYIIFRLRKWAINRLSRQYFYA